MSTEGMTDVGSAPTTRCCGMCGAAHPAVGYFDYSVPGGDRLAVARLFVCERHFVEAQQFGHGVHRTKEPA